MSNTGYTGSTYPSGQIGTVKRYEIPCFAASPPAVRCVQQ